MGLGKIFQELILEILNESKGPLTRNDIKTRLEEKHETKFSWHTVNAHLQVLVERGDAEKINIGKFDVYQKKGKI